MKYLYFAFPVVSSFFNLSIGSDIKLICLMAACYFFQRASK